MPDLAITFRKPFAEQVAALRIRLSNLIPTERWTDVWQSAHDRGFMVAGAAKADLLADLAGAVDKAVSQGTTLDQFRKDFREIVSRHGWTGWTGEGSARGEAWRTRVIYQTNMRTSYMSGRHAQLLAGNYKWWVYRHSGAEHPRLHHLALDGIALPPDHPFWKTHFPPNGWGCGCEVYGAHTLAGIRRVGGDPNKQLPEGWDKRDPAGNLPAISKGWDYAPGATVADAINALTDKLPGMPAKIGAAFGATIRKPVDDSWQRWLDQIKSGQHHRPGLLGTLDPSLVDRLVQLGSAPQSAEILVKPGLVSGPKARRHTAKGDALSDEDWSFLPRALQAPRAVLLDLDSGNLLYVLPASDGQSQIAVALDYWLKDRTGRRQVNFVVSAYRPPIDTLRARMKAGRIQLLQGKL